MKDKTVVYAISPDSPENSRAFIEKINADGKGSVNFAVLADPGSATIDRYALRDPAYAREKVDGIPRPAVFVLDRQGTVRWSRIESDYKQRPSLDAIRAALLALE